MQRICVFCGSQLGTQPVHKENARLLGRLLAQRGISLVYGAGNVGLMGILADATLEAGGEVVGVIPKALVEKEVAHSRLTALHVVDTMHQRKALMADLADGFAALPGGFGTSDELFEILTCAQLGFHSKPVSVLNTAGYFDPLLRWLDHMVEEGFLKPRHRALVQVAESPEQLLSLFAKKHQAPALNKWIEVDDR